MSHLIPLRVVPNSADNRLFRCPASHLAFVCNRSKAWPGFSDRLSRIIKPRAIPPFFCVLIAESTTGGAFGDGRYRAPFVRVRILRIHLALHFCSFHQVRASDYSIQASRCFTILEANQYDEALAFHGPLDSECQIWYKDAFHVSHRPVTVSRRVQRRISLYLPRYQDDTSGSIRPQLVERSDLGTQEN
jgi:hypothetical protein